jgi:hypothetical protein
MYRTFCIDVIPCYYGIHAALIGKKLSALLGFLIRWLRIVATMNTNTQPITRISNQV